MAEVVDEEGEKSEMRRWWRVEKRRREVAGSWETVRVLIAFVL